MARKMMTFEATPAKLTHMAYCGMPSLPFVDDLAAARQEAARRIRRYRAAAFPVSVLERGKVWEIGEPVECAMIPDSCGTLRLKFLCDECTNVTVDEPGWACEDCQEALDAAAEQESEEVLLCDTCREPLPVDRMGDCDACIAAANRQYDEEVARVANERFDRMANMLRAAYPTRIPEEWTR